MRPARLLGVLASTLVLCLTTQAADTRTATILVPEIDVRSGPSLKFYPTSKLRQGQTVEVLAEKDGWLAIRPPADSFSWINVRHVDDHRPAAVVKLNDAPVRMGSRLYAAEPTVERFRAPLGTQVTVIGGKTEAGSDGSSYLAIQPLAMEYRYIPVDAVRSPTSAATNLLSAAPAAAAAPVGDGRWQSALLAEQRGLFDEAIRLYAELGAETSTSNPFLAAECNRRAQWHREGRQRSAPGTVADNRPSAPVSTWGAVNAPAQGRTTSQYSTTAPPAPVQADAGWRPQGQAAPSPQPTANASPAVQRRSGPGWLKRAPFYIENKPAYVLESSNGQLRLYVTAMPGVNLEPFVNRGVELAGPTVYHGELRTNYMTVQQVMPLQ